MPTQAQIDLAKKYGYTQEQINQEMATPGTVKRSAALGAPVYEQPVNNQYASATTIPNQTPTPTSMPIPQVPGIDYSQNPGGTMPLPPNTPLPIGSNTAQPGSVQALLGEGFGAEDPFITKYAQDQLSAYNQPIDENTIRRQKEAEMQAQIDAINAVYADRKRQEQQKSQGRLGSGRALQARSGLLNSDFGTAQTEQISQLNREQEQSVENERLALVNQLLSGAARSAADEIAAKRAAKEAGGKAYLDYLSGASTRKQEKVSKAAQLLLSLGKSPQDISDAELKQAGISRQDLTMEYTAGKSAQDAASAEAQAKAEKAALEALKTQSEINKNQADIINEALKTGRVYESGGYIFDGATNEVIGNAQAVQKASTSRGTSGGTGGYSGGSGGYSGSGGQPSAPYSPQSDPQLEQIGNSTEGGLFMDSRTGKTITGNQAQQLYGSQVTAPTKKGSKYTDEQLSVMSVITGKPTAGDKNTLRKYGLTEADLGNYRTGNIAQKSNYDKLDANTKSRIDRYALDFENEQVVKDYNTMAVNVEAVKNLPKSNTNDQQLIYTFAKVMDPNSVVRESEYATVQEYSQALVQRYLGKIKRLYSTDGFLSEDAKQKMIETLNGKLQTQKKSYDNVRDQTKKQIQNKAPELKKEEVDDLLKQYTFSGNAPAATSESSDWDV